MTYDELLDAVRGRVGRYAAASDAEDVLDPAGLRDVEALLAVAPYGGTDDAWHAAGLLHYARHLVLPDGEREADLAAAEPLLDRVRATFTDLPEQLRKLDEAATRPVRLTPGRVAVFTYAGSALKEVDDVIVMIRHRLRSLPADDPDVLQTRASLTEAQELRFGRTGDVADLDAAIATAQGVLPDTSADDPRYPHRISALAQLFQLRFVAGADPADLDTSVQGLRDAVAAAPDDDEDHPMHQSNLGRALLTRYTYASPEPGDLDEALEVMTAAVSTTPVGDLGRGTRLTSLHQAHQARFHRDHDPADLTTAVALAEEALTATPPEHPDHLERVLHIAAILLTRYRVTGATQDVKLAITLAKRVMRVTPTDHPMHEVARSLRDAARSARRA